MDQPKVAPETFILKANIHCQGCEKKIKKLLQDIRGVDKISIDALQGRITISGNIDPQKLMEHLRKNGKKSELLWVAPKDLEGVPRSKPLANNNNHVIHDKDVEQLQKLSEIKRLKTVEISRNAMKITFKEHENLQDLAGKTDYSAASSSDWPFVYKKYYYGEHVTGDYCDFHGYHHCCCSRNQAMYTQYNHGCPQTNCRCMASPGNISLGIPLPGYTPSAPPVPDEYYCNDPPQEKSYDHPLYTAFSDENPTGCIMM